MTDLEFIKKFSKIRISNICKNLKISTIHRIMLITKLDG